MNILGVIPARYGSQRFPAKMLALLGGRPLIHWVYEAARTSGVFSEVVLATDHDEIVQSAQQISANVEMTSPDHQTGTDRVAEVAARHAEAEIVVNIQGDQPFVTQAMLQALVEPYLAGREPHMTTLGCPFADDAVRQDPHSVKAVCDQNRNAMLFTRSPVPYFRQRGIAPVYHHLGLYAFQREFLEIFAKLPQTPLELCEQLEQLRALEHGYTIEVSLTEKLIAEVNTREDLERAEAAVGRGEVTFPGTEETE